MTYHLNDFTFRMLLLLIGFIIGAYTMWFVPWSIRFWNGRVRRQPSIQDIQLTYEEHLNQMRMQTEQKMYEAVFGDDANYRQRMK